MIIIKKTVIFLLLLITSAGMWMTHPQAQAADAASKAGVVSVSYGNLNIRSDNSTSSPIVARFVKGSYITLLSKSGDWWYVEYGDGKFGYCSARYISQVTASAKKVDISGGNLNIRSGAGIGFAIVDKLSKGAVVLETSTVNGWSRVLYHGSKLGYIKQEYLTPVTVGYVQNSAISLNVPSYKQTDSRWANVKIGSSGKTISKIGCTTTAIAMMETFRTGSVIYPDAMSKKLSYTSAGDLYWPKNYTVVTNGSGYLSGIYNKLRQGKPVLFGAKNSYGSQHWVVITGFKGGNLTASNFTINDPGSNSRNNLQQFLNSYPAFYKYFYY